MLNVRNCSIRSSAPASASTRKTLGISHAAVSITAPLFVLVMAFQRQIVSGLTQGAVKG